MSETESRSRWWRSWKIALPTLLFLLVASHTIWTALERRRFDGIIAAIQQRNEPILPPDFNVLPVDPSINAGADIEAAIALMNLNAPEWEEFDRLQIENARFPLSSEEKQGIGHILQFAGPALQAFEKGDDKKLSQSAVMITSPAIAMLLPHLSYCRRLQHLLSARALEEHEMGRDHDALRDLERVRIVSRYVDSFPALASHLTANRLETASAETAVKISISLQIGAAEGQATPADVRRLIDLYLDDKESNQMFQRAFDAERMMTADTITCIASGSPKAARLGVPLVGAHPMLQYLIAPITYSNGTRALRYMNSIVQQIDADNWPAVNTKLSSRPVSSPIGSMYYAIANLIMPSLNRAAENQFQSLTARRLAAISLATNWYAVEHASSFPPNLEALVPKYLPAVPLDPMSATNTPLRYKPDGPKPIIYSVGENAIDDDGDISNINKRLTRPPETNSWDAKDFVVPLYAIPRPAPQPVPE